MQSVRVATLLIGVSVLCAVSFGQNQNGKVTRIGNPVNPSNSGVDVEGAIFLLNDVVLSEGVVFAFSAFFRSDSAVRFQIWRPVEMNDTDTSTVESQEMSLVAELAVIPSVVYSREDVYFESKLTEKCIRVKQGDRVGVYLQDAPGSISFIFDSSDPQSLSHTLKNTSIPYATGDKVTFDPLTFPYDFSVAAYVDIDLSKYENETGDRVECPKGLMIPEYIDVTLPPTTKAPITGAPGATGSTGPSGQMGGTGPRGGVGPNGITGLQGGTGFTGPMGKEGVTGGAGATGSTGPAGPVGDSGTQGEKGDQGDQGERGQRGEAGPAATLPPNFGKNGENGGALTGASSSMDAFSNPLIVLICIIWLIIVTVLLVVLICVICCVVRRQKRNEDDELRHVAVAGGHIGGVAVEPIPSDDYPYESIKGSKEDGLNGGMMVGRDRLVSSKSTRSANDPEWISDMKGISSSTYSLDTITRDGQTIRHKDGAAYVNAGAVLDDEARSATMPRANNTSQPDHDAMKSASSEALNTPADPEHVHLSREDINMY